MKNNNDIDLVGLFLVAVLFGSVIVTGLLTWVAFAYPGFFGQMLAAMIVLSLVLSMIFPLYNGKC